MDLRFLGSFSNDTKLTGPNVSIFLNLPNSSFQNLPKPNSSMPKFFVPVLVVHNSLVCTGQTTLDNPKCTKIIYTILYIAISNTLSTESHWYNDVTYKTHHNSDHIPEILPSGQKFN